MKIGFSYTTKQTGDVIRMFGFNNKQMTVIGGILALVVLVIMGMSVPMTGDSSSGIPATEASDPGGGINPNSAGADPVVVVEPERSASVPVKYLTEKEFLRLTEDRGIIKEEILYLCEFKYEYEDLTNEVPVGFILFDKDRLPDLEFGFEGIYLSNFSPETREDKKYLVILTADMERSGYQSIRWNALLLDSNKNLVGSANVDKGEKLNFWFNGDIWGKGKFILIEMTIIQTTIVTTVNNE